MKRPELSIILPCYNEARNIPIVTECLARFWPDINFELVLVNNGSTDDSARVLQELKKRYDSFISIVTIQKNIGYGHGILTGLKNARAEILAYSHADIQTPPEDIITAYSMLKDQKHDMEKALIKGLRINRRKEERFFTKALENIAGLSLGYKMHDANGQPKLFHRNLLGYFMHPPLDFSFDVYVMYKALQNGFGVETFPVDFGQRMYGKSKWSSSSLKKCKTIFGYLKNIFLISLRNISDNNNPIKRFAKFCKELIR